MSLYISERPPFSRKGVVSRCNSAVLIYLIRRCVAESRSRVVTEISSDGVHIDSENELTLQQHFSMSGSHSVGAFQTLTRDQQS